MNLKSFTAIFLATLVVVDVVHSSSNSFVDVDEDLRRFQRNLLQADDEKEKESTEAPVKETTEAPKKRGKFVHGEYSLGIL